MFVRRRQKNRQQKKSVGSVSTFYFYGPSGIISEFSTDTGLSNATAASTNDKTAFETADRQGTAALLIAASGLVLENNRTLPYGELWCPEPSSQTTKKNEGYERDSESGLDYALNRYVAVNYGRFTSKDQGGAQLFRPISLNRYVYVSADPVNRTDPDGKQDASPTYGISITVTGTPVPPSPFSGTTGFGGGSGGGPPDPDCEDFAPGGCSGGGSSSGGGPDDVVKSYGGTFACNTNAAGIMSQIMSNFSAFGNVSTNFGPGGVPVASANVTFGTPGQPTAISLGAVIPINLQTTIIDPDTGQPIPSLNLTVGVKVSNITTGNFNSFTFTTLPGHVLYPANITFSVVNAGNGQIQFGISIDGNFASLAAEAQYYAGGNNLEDKIWTNFSNNVQQACQKTQQ